ncbi:tyrosine-protein phosphatase [Rhizorhabdus sp.]|uniref:tyrosine-protein phosphatase n=1 Tax=Rhizorhabdus sp. TaxID=1968843 RepID=UPI0025D202F1|nr:tyrosine-protein phosphatase [Rhizorhabdus sp.]
MARAKLRTLAATTVLALLGLGACTAPAPRERAAIDRPPPASATPQLQGAPNFGDLGGYQTGDGRRVKPGLLFRSDQLDRLTDADLAAMEGLRLAYVVDLRTESERAREPDRLPRGARHIILDVSADADGSLGGDMRKAQAAIAAGRGVELLEAANRDFVSLPSAQAAYRALFALVADPATGPLVYHCTAGKDRTGWASAVLLSILGVPRERIFYDYLASNTYLAQKNAGILASLKASGAPIDPANLEPVLGVRRAYLDSAFAEVDRVYGSMDAYVRKGLGLSDAQIDMIRRKYLER